MKIFVWQSTVTENFSYLHSMFYYGRNYANLCKNPAIKLNVKVAPKPKFENLPRGLLPKHTENLLTKSARMLTSLTKWYFLNNYEIYILFHLESSFHSQDIHFFGFLSSLSFLVGHYFRGWSKIFDVVNCLIQNLILCFVWYIEMEKRHDIDTLLIDRILNKYIFTKKSCRKCTPKASPNFFLIGIHYMQDWGGTTRHGVTRKDAPE